MRFTRGEWDITLDCLQGRMPLPGGVLLGIGSAPGGIKDALAFYWQCPETRVFAVNDAIPAWPHQLEFAGSLHGRYLVEQAPKQARLPWLVARRIAPRPLGVSTSRRRGVQLMFSRVTPGISSSGMLPVLLGLALEVEAIVLAGVRLTGSHADYIPDWRSAHASGLLDRVFTATDLTGLPLGELLRPAWQPYGEAA